MIMGFVPSGLPWVQPMGNKVAALQAAGCIPSGCRIFPSAAGCIPSGCGVFSMDHIGRENTILKGSNYISPGPCPGCNNEGFLRP